jgi:serine/threonine protein phosphatase 1
MLWIRNEFIATNADFGKIVVHGHTPMARPSQRPNRIGIDTGAWSSHRLTAAVLEGTGCRFLST